MEETEMASAKWVEGNTGTFQASAALSRYRRVRLSTGKLAYAGASDQDCLGVLLQPVLAADEYAAVLLHTASGTKPMVASGIISAYAAVYAAANGKVASSGTVIVGIALQASGADGDEIEVLQSPIAAAIGSVDRSGLTEDALASYMVPLGDLKTTGTMQPLGAAAGTPSGACGITAGTYGSATPKVVGEAANNNSKTDYCRFQFALPPEYVDGGDVKLIVAGAVGAAMAVAATVDVQAFLSDGGGGVDGTDLCATAAQSINSTDFAAKTFTITSTGLVKGDVLDIQLTLVANDTGGTANDVAIIGSLGMALDIKG